jgi:hypothetical protein
MVQGIKEYSVTYTPLGGVPYTVSGTYVVDGTPPVVTQFQASPALTGGDALSISYAVTDYSNNMQFCAGVAGFEIASDAMFQNIVTNVPLTVASLSDCAKTGVLTVAPPTQSGQYTWYARAYDRVGNYAFSVVQADFEVDAEPPEIFQPLLYKEGVQVNYTDVGTNEYELVFDIRELHGLLVVPTVDIATGAGRCIQTGDENFECRYRVIATTTSSSTSISGTINAEDTLGNSIRLPFSVGIQIDADAPLIGFFGSEYGQYIKRAGNTLKLHAQEQESGFDKTTVYADLHLINPSYGAAKHPDECSGEYCYWYNIAATTTRKISTSRVYISDFLGHQSFMDVDFELDTQLPVIESVEQLPLYPTAETGITWLVNVTDDNGVSSAVANISDISTLDALLEGVCTESGNLFVCQFDADELKTYANPGDILFNITDVAGNSATKLHKMILYESDMDSVPNEIDVDALGPLPDSIPKEIATNIDYKLYIPLRVTYRSADTQIVAKGLPNCYGIQNLSILPDYGTYNPYWLGEDYLVFVVKLDSVSGALANIEFNCTVDFIVRKRSKIFFNPEREEIYANVSIKSTSLIDDAMVTRLKDLHDTIEDDLDWATDWDKTVQDIIGFCDSFQIFKDTYDFLQTIKPIIYGILSIIYAFPWGKDAANTGWKGYNMLVCYMAVAKNYAWPNSDPRNLGQYNQPSQTGSIWSDWSSVRGWVRNICSFIKCRQCNTDWSVTNQLANMNFNWTQVGDPDSYASSTSLNSRLRQGNGSFSRGGLFEGVDLSVSVDPFRSWAVSIACLCLPGIVHNINKYRQIECMHAKCLIENAKLGQSTDFCDKQDEQRKCVFWLGGLLHLIPGYLFFKMISEKAEQVLRNLPARLALAAVDSGCKVFHENIRQTGASSCPNTQAGRTQELADCKMECMPDIPSPANGKFIGCTLLDSAMLIWAWDDMVDNAFDSSRYEFWDRDDFVDQCQGIDWASAGVS